MTTTSPSPALDTLQAGRAFAALAVLLFHVELTLNLPQYLDHAVVPAFRMGFSGVHFFFVLSGFVILLATRRDIGAPGRVATFAWKRARRIYPPLWAALAIVVPATLLWPPLNNGVGFGALDVLSAATLVPATFDPVLSVVWTLRHEALFYAVFALVLWRPRLGLAVGAAWMALSAALPWTPLVREDWIRFFFTSQHLLFAFGAGALLLFERGPVRAPAGLMAGGVLLFAATWAIPLMKLPLNGILANWMFGLGAAAAILGAAELERRGRLKTPRWLAFLGEASYAIYLIHAPIVYAAASAALALAPGLKTAPGLLFGLVALASLGGGLLFHVWIEKPLLARMPNALPRRSGQEKPEASATQAGQGFD